MERPKDSGTEDCIRESKSFRVELDATLQKLKAAGRTSRERCLAVTKIQEAIMWLGMDLKALNDGVSCYAEGYNPDSPVVEPTADGLKM